MMAASKSLGQLLPEAQLDRVYADMPVRALCLDSRRVQAGDAFVAIPGTASDGRQFTHSALAQGASLIISEACDQAYHLDLLDSVPNVAVPDLASSLSGIAGEFFGRPSEAMHLVGITGTNGKTTCSVLLAQLYRMLGETAGVVGTLGYGLADQNTCANNLKGTGLTTPDAIQAQATLAELNAQGASAVMMEVSSHSLDQHRVAGLDFDVAIFTNLSRDHLDYHGDMAAYGKAKRQLFEMPGLRTAIINIDDEFGAELALSLKQQSFSLLTYSCENSQADLFASDICYQARGVEATLVSPWGEGRINSALLGTYNLSNLLAVIAAACSDGKDLESVLKVLPSLEAIEGRMQNVDASADIQVVVDYAHTPDALEQTLKALRTHGAGKLWCVFGCGGDRDPGKRRLMAEVSERLSDHSVVTSDNPRSESPEAIVADIVKGLSAGASFDVETDRAAAIAYAVAAAAPGDTVLIAGKGHEDYQVLSDKTIAFSDIAEAKKSLKQRANQRGTQS